MRLRWRTFFVLAAMLLFCKLELFRRFNLEIKGCRPDLLLTLAIYIALFVQPRQAILVGWFLGLLYDITSCEKYGLFAGLFCLSNGLIIRFRQEIMIEHPLVMIMIVFWLSLQLNFLHALIISWLHGVELFDKSFFLCVIYDNVFAFPHCAIQKDQCGKMMQKTIKKRIKTGIILLALIFPCIFLRLMYIQVILHSEYSQAASANLDRCRDITPRRGAIYDHYGVMLAKTAPTYHVYVRVAKIVQKKGERLLLRQRSIINLSKLLKIPAEEIIAKIMAIRDKLSNDIQKKLREYQELAKKKPRKYQRKKRSIEHDYYNRVQLLVKDISHQAACTFFCEQCEFEITGNQAKVVDRYEGFNIIPTVSRHYPLQNVAPQLLGHIGAITNPDKYPRNKDYEITDMVGKSGIELLMENELRGRRGCLVRSRQGKIFAEEPTEGMEIHLTLNATLQKMAEQELDQMVVKAKATGGAAVVIDIYTGAILTLASSPRYDNNLFSKEYSKLRKESHRPLLNRAIGYYYPIPPGSIFKVILAVYALEKGIIDINTTHVCRGFFAVPGRYRCTHVHGAVNVIEAIAGSCNVFFYHVGQDLGPQGLAECARIFGFGEKSGLDLSGESEGLVPTPEWKKRKIGNNWSVGR